MSQTPPCPQTLPGSSCSPSCWRSSLSPPPASCVKNVIQLFCFLFYFPGKGNPHVYGVPQAARIVKGLGTDDGVAWSAILRGWIEKKRLKLGGRIRREILLIAAHLNRIWRRGRERPPPSTCLCAVGDPPPFLEQLSSEKIGEQLWWHRGKFISPHFYRAICNEICHDIRDKMTKRPIGGDCQFVYLDCN